MFQKYMFQHIPDFEDCGIINNIGSSQESVFYYDCDEAKSELEWIEAHNPEVGGQHLQCTCTRSCVNE